MTVVSLAETTADRAWPQRDYLMAIKRHKIELLTTADALRDAPRRYLVKGLMVPQAAIRAGYPEKAAYATGAENLRKPQIANAVA